MESNEGTFAAWLKDQLDYRGWKQTDFARRMGIQSQTVSSWMHGVEPRARTVYLIARTLGFSAESVFRMLAGEPVTEAGFHSPRSITDLISDAVAVAPVPVPLIRASDARLKANAPATEYLYLPTAYRTDSPKRYFAIVAPDDAMAPAILTGDTLVIDPTVRPRLDEIAIIAVAERVILGRLTDMGGRRLYRQDATGETVTARKAGDLLGVVIVIMRSMRR